jgi:lipoate-protein ligase A
MMTAIDFPPLEPAEILATEEVLLEAAEAGKCGETLSFWESSRPFIVLGYSNNVHTEVNQPACERLGIPILRRVSGGGTVLQGPGVLNYSLVLRAAENSPLASITGANRFIMQRNADALTRLLKVQPATCNPNHVVTVQGHTDLAIAGRKFSGNAQRRKRTHLLFHGTILLQVDLDLIEQVLPSPSLQPDYRLSRSHRDFLTPFPAKTSELKTALEQAWSAVPGHKLDSLVIDWRGTVARLVAEKYSRTSWNLRE